MASGGRTEYILLQGKAKWVKPTAPDKYGNYSMVLYPNQESYNKLLDLKQRGLKNEIKKDEDGYSITLRRPQSKTYNGKVKGFAPPEIIGPDNLPFRQLIGNGSDVTAKIEVYPYHTPQGNSAIAMRWMALRVDNHVPYDKKDFDDEQYKAFAGFEEKKPEGF